MSGDWIKMRSDLSRDPAVFAIAEKLKLDRDTVVGKLHRFWAWADALTVDGVVDGATSQVVDAVVDAPGFASALESVKWLNGSPGGPIRIPLFERHNGASAKARALKNQRQARWRAGKEPPPVAGGNVDGEASTRVEKSRVEEVKPSTRFARRSVSGVGARKSTARKPSLVGAPDVGTASSPAPEARAPASSERSVAQAAPQSEAVTPGSAVWEAYSAAYRMRWGVAPVRNARVNSLCKQFAALMTQAEAIGTIHHFLRSNRGIYISAKHDLALAVRDAQALRTDWLNGTHGTDAAARRHDATAARGEVFQRVIDETEGGGNDGQG